MSIRKSWFVSIFLGVIVGASALVTIPISYGTFIFRFSLLSILIPLIAVSFSVSRLIVMCLVRIILGSIGFTPQVFFGFPTMVAGLSWYLYNTNKKSPTFFLIHAGIPLICITAFLLHPVGAHAPFYAFFWLVPLFIMFVWSYFSYWGLEVFACALSTTFLSHALGSLCWLYTIPSTPGQWYALIPVVIVERICFASGMTAMYYGARLFFCNATRFYISFSDSIKQR